MISKPMPRRGALKSLLQAGVGLASAGTLSEAIKARELDARSDQKTRSALTDKFHADGTVAYWPGNSIICHIDKRSECFLSLLDIHRGLMHSGMTHRIAVLPPASYHMTVFNGVSYPARNVNFPSDIPHDATEKFCDEWLLDKLKKFDLGCELPFRMRPLPLAAQTNLYNILLEPVDQAEKAKIRSLRDRLAAALNYRLADHAVYQYHITLNYFFSKMEPGEEVEFSQLHQKLVDGLIKRSPIIELQNPEYVLFDDMYEFRRQLFLENKTLHS
jgi:hypothetical protein